MLSSRKFLIRKFEKLATLRLRCAKCVSYNESSKKEILKRYVAPTRNEKLAGPLKGKMCHNIHEMEAVTIMTHFAVLPSNLTFFRVFSFLRIEFFFRFAFHEFYLELDFVFAQWW